MIQGDNKYLSPFEIDQLGKSGDLREALNFALHEIREGSREVQLYYLAATLAYDLGDIQKSEQLLKLLLSADPEHINGWLLFGKIHRRKGDLARSAYGFNRAEEIFPALVEFNILNNLKAPQPSKDAENSSAGDGMSFETRTFADICVKQGYYNKALKIYSELKEKQPDDPEIGQKIDEIKRKMGKND
jgi:tetratricopeptide (TPR) repeat protein